VGCARQPVGVTDCVGHWPLLALMTLWSVSGPETLEVLRDFAARLSRGEERLTALRGAQMEISDHSIVIVEIA
jgi:hypothetical protein